MWDECYESGLFEEAAKYYNNYLKSSSIDDYIFIEIINRLIMIDHCEDAILFCKRAIANYDLNSWRLRFYTLMGFAYWMLENYDEAILNYTKAMDILDDEITQCKYRISKTEDEPDGYDHSHYYDSLSRYEKEYDYYKVLCDKTNLHDALQWSKKSETFYYLDEKLKFYKAAYAKCNQMSGKLTSNGEENTNIVNFDLANTWYNRGVGLYKECKFEEAIKAFDKSIEYMPQYQFAWNNKGIALYALAKYNEALEAFNKAIEINPYYSNAWLNKSIALKKLDRTTESDEAYVKATRLS